MVKEMELFGGFDRHVYIKIKFAIYRYDIYDF